MAWIVVIVVLLAIIGPVVYLMPSKRERQLADVRMIARRAGLGVALTHIPKLDAAAEERVSAGGVQRDPTIECASYKLMFPRRLDAAPCWYVLRGASTKRREPIDGWTSVSAIDNVSVTEAPYWSTVTSLVEAMPGGCLAVEATPNYVAWMGTERLGGEDAETVVDTITQQLRTLADLHSEMDQKADNFDDET